MMVSVNALLSWMLRCLLKYWWRPSHLARPLKPRVPPLPLALEQALPTPKIASSLSLAVALGIDREKTPEVLEETLKATISKSLAGSRRFRQSWGARL